MWMKMSSYITSTNHSSKTKLLQAHPHCACQLSLIVQYSISISNLSKTIDRLGDRQDVFKSKKSPTTFSQKKSWSSLIWPIKNSLIAAGTHHFWHQPSDHADDTEAWGSNQHLDWSTFEWWDISKYVILLQLRISISCLICIVALRVDISTMLEMNEGVGKTCEKLATPTSNISAFMNEIGAQGTTYLLKSWYRQNLFLVFAMF